MHPAYTAAPRVAPPDRPPDQPAAYIPIPQRLITDLHDNPLAIGLYGLIARLYLVAQAPIPLSVPDVQRYDPALSRGAVLRALARLSAAGYLLETAQAGLKTRYTPAWGRVGGMALAWQVGQPCLGRPRHVARLRVDRRLLDICMGKLVPHPTRAAAITRYITAPVISLADLGCYALTLAGLPRATPALIRLGALRGGDARALPDDARLLAQISQRALDLDSQDQPCAQPELTAGGARRLGLAPLLVPAERPATHTLFFVPPGLIGSMIAPLIGSMIGSTSRSQPSFSPSQSANVPSDADSQGITCELSDQAKAASSPPSSPQRHGGGGKRAKLFSSQELPENEITAALRGINVRPAQIAELANTPQAVVAAAIADGQARPGVRDLAAWVVSLLRSHRDHGWKIAPPVPAPESPAALRETFARYAAEQAAALGAAAPEAGSDCSAAIRASESLALEQAGSQPSIGGDDDTAGRQLPAAGTQALTRQWGMVLEAMRLRVPRPEFTMWLQPIVLQSLDAGVATLIAPSAPAKEALERRHLGAIRAELAALLGAPAQVRVLIGVPPPAAGPPAAPDQRPSWIAPERWLNLPAVLRAALIGSSLVDGAVVARSPHLERLLATRYQSEVAALVAHTVAGT
jgi:hypothetical protein